MTIKKPVVVNNDTHSELLAADTLDATSIAIDNDSMLSVDAGKLTTTVTTNSSPTLQITGQGSSLTPLTGSVIVSPVAGNALTATPQGLFASGNVGVITDNTNSIQISGNGTSGSHLGAAVRVSADANNSLEVKTDGLYVPAGGTGGSITTGDTATIELLGDGSATPLSANSKISVDIDNILVANGDGLYVNGATIITDSSTVALTGKGLSLSPLMAEVNISADVGNSIEKKSDGLYAPISNVNSFNRAVSTNTVTPEVNASKGILEIITCSASGTITCDLSNINNVDNYLYKVRLILTTTTPSTLRFSNSPMSAIMTPIGTLNTSSTPTYTDYGIDYDKILIVDIECGLGYAPNIVIVQTDYNPVISGNIPFHSFTYTSGTDVTIPIFTAFKLPMYSGSFPKLHLRIALMAPSGKTYNIGLGTGGLVGNMIHSIFNANYIVYGNMFNTTENLGDTSPPVKIVYDAGYNDRQCVLNVDSDVLDKYLSTGDNVFIQGDYVIEY